jgi:hypothetical protein
LTDSDGKLDEETDTVGTKNCKEQQPDLRHKRLMDTRRELHPLLSLISACFSVICAYLDLPDIFGIIPTTPAVWLLTWVNTSAQFLLLSVPRWIYAVLSYSFTLTVSTNVLNHPSSS